MPVLHKYSISPCVMCTIHTCTVRMTERQRQRSWRFDNGTPNNSATDALYQKQGMYNLVHAEIGIAQPSAVALQSTGGGEAG